MTRIVWSPVSDDVLTGRVGRLALFTIERGADDRPWQLTTRLPIAYTYSGGRTAADTKTVAEKILDGFLAAIGATIPA